MLKNHKKLLSLVLALIFVGIFVWYVRTHWVDFKEINLSYPLLLSPAAIMIALNIFTIGMVFEIAIKPHGVKISRNEIFGLSVLTRFSKQVSPAYLAATLRAVYFKKKYNISYAKFSSSFFLSNIMQLIVSGILALSIYLLNEKTLLNSKPIIIILAIVVAFLFLVYGPIPYLVSLVDKHLSKYKNKVAERLIAASGYYDRLRSQPKVLYPMIFWIIITLLASTITLILLYNSLSFKIELVSALFISALVGWSMVFSITPAGIGVREGLMVLGATLMNVPVPETLAVAILLRLITFVVVTLLSAYYTPKLFNTSLFQLKEIGK